ncbi:MFS transporter [Novosphingobium guangzhouense]|uniref:MFS transporter n=2 Tax=Novosphingobium guangzhouense TaxID=1850347 RepID=A0A2K2FV08_9SPHN|nr:MFS transporter [Novosphingobium guangzhouense]PNU02621.1 MFS transporter [Novosphingobium guangzhouense]
MQAKSTTETPAPAGASRHLVLGMLLLVYVFNFVDRQILSILAAPIQADLGLDDAQMGMLGGLAFAILYSTLGVPLAWVADRTSRSWVITGSLVVWSVFTSACALATGFWHIFLARLGVGVGEAGGVAPSYAVIGDHFPSKSRAFALSVYSLGIPLGSAAGVLAGGYVAQAVDWRTAFLVVGLCGILIAPVFKLVVSDKPRCTTRPAVRFSDVARTLSRKRSFWFLSFGAASSSMLGYGVAFWLPSLLQRSFHLSLVETSWFFGAVLLLGGTTGVLTGGALADRLGKADRAWYGRVPALGFVCAVPLYAGAIWTSSVPLAFLLFLLPQVLAYFWLGPVTGAIQHLVDPPARATASALFLLINNLIGLGGGIYALGALSKALAPVWGGDSLRYSMLFALILYLLAALLMTLAGPGLRKEWVEEK